MKQLKIEIKIIWKWEGKLLKDDDKVGELGLED